MKIETKYNNNKTRRWLLKATLHPDPASPCVIILANPPHHSNEEDCVTRRALQIAKKLGYEYAEIVCLSPICSDNFSPKIQMLSKNDWANNLKYLERSIKGLNQMPTPNTVPDIICAWGHTELRYLAVTINHFAAKLQNKLLCFAVNQDGTPRSPKFLPLNSKLIPYEPI